MILEWLEWKSVKQWIDSNCKILWNLIHLIFLNKCFIIPIKCFSWNMVITQIFWKQFYLCILQTSYKTWSLITTICEINMFCFIIKVLIINQLTQNAVNHDNLISLKRSQNSSLYSLMRKFWTIHQQINYTWSVVLISWILAIIS